MKKMWSYLLVLSVVFIFNFTIVKAESLESGVYTIQSALNSDKVITMDNYEFENTGPKLYTYHNSDNQKWKIENVDDEYYIISSFGHEDMILGISDKNEFSNSNVYISKNTDTINQRWLLKYDGDGYYNIISNLNNLYLDVSKSSLTDGTDIIGWNGTNGVNQKFKFIEVIQGEKTLEDGTYTISSALDFNKNINVKGNSASNEINVDLYKNNDTWGQIWNVKYLDNGYYSLTTYLNDKMSLDVYGGKAKNGTNVQLYNHHGGLGQQWLLKYIGDGYYNIISGLNNKYVDIANGKNINGANVIVWDGHGGTNQKFKFELIDVQKIENGWYTLSSKLDSNKVLTTNSDIAFDESNVHLETNKENNSQKWHITYLKNGYYKITSGLDQGKSLDVYGGKTKNGTNVQLYNYHGGLSQQWIIKYVGDGYYSLVSNCSSLYLDVFQSSIVDGTNIIMWDKNDKDNQKFKLQKTSPAENFQTIKDGYYTISMDNEYLSIDNQFAYNSANVLLKKDIDDSSKWYIKNVGNNLYEVRYALNPNKILDVNKGSVLDGTNVQIYTNNSTINQRWYIAGLNDGTYKIISSKSYSPLTIDNGNAVIYSNNIYKKQKFTISSIDPINYGRVIDDGYYTIYSSLNKNKALDVYRANIASGTNVQLYSHNNSLGQIWKVKYLNDGMYSIISSLNPKRALTNLNGNISINKYTENDNQKWYISALDNGSFSIVSVADGLFVNVTSEKALNETNIDIQSSNNTLNQKFIIEEYKGVKTYKGIDISKWQGNINWKLLASENPHFIIMRVGRGIADLGKDVKFDEYYKNATNYDIPVGVYIYSFANNLNESKREAEYVIEWLDNRKLDLPVFYDMEYSGQLYLGKEVLTKMAENFCSTIISNNYHCGIYANIYWLMNFLDGNQLSNKYPIWLAHWTGANDYNTALGNLEKYKSPYNLSPYKYWQFSSLGKYQAITENTVDLDFGYDIFD